MKIRHELALILLLLVVSAPTRLLGLEQLPPGLFHDEAYEGLDAVRIVAGARPVFLPENYGREPLYAYVMAALIAIGGPTVVAVRATSAIFGLLAIPAAYLWARVFFGSTAGLLTAATAAASYWLLHESRLGMRPIALPFFLALTSTLAWLAARHRCRWAWPAAGLILGICLYTYLPARIFPLVIAGQVALGLRARWREHPRSVADLAGPAALAVVAGLVAMPLLLYFRAAPDDATSRASVVSIFAAGSDHPIAVLASNLALNLGMFVWRGDDTIRHNLPYRPVYDLLMAPFFLIGAWWSLRRLRTPEHAALWLWLAAMLMPGLMSDSAPHFLRSIGLLPALFVLPAVGLIAAWRWACPTADWQHARVRWRRLAAGAALVAIPCLSQVLTWRDYFWSLPRDAGLAESFDARLAALARVAGDPPAGTSVELPTPGWSHATIRFLRPRSFAAPAPQWPADARFGTVVQFLGYSVASDSPGPGGSARLTLYWRGLREMNATYVESIRAVDRYGRVWWQREGEPGLGTLPTDTWQPGEVVADHMPLNLAAGAPPDDLQLEIALSQPDGGRRLPVTLAGGRPVGNSLKLEGLVVGGPSAARPTG